MIRKVYIYFHANWSLQLWFPKKQLVGRYSASIGGNFNLT